MFEKWKIYQDDKPNNQEMRKSELDELQEGQRDLEGVMRY